MKIYTKTGDKGETGLLGGVRVSKSHLAIEACGSLDELNSLLGLAASYLNGADAGNSDANGVLAEIKSAITQFQRDLFDIGSCVAACLSDTNRTSKLDSARSSELEKLIDRFEEKLPEMTAFILPDGSTAGCQMHHARSVCRRTERRLVELIELAGQESNPSFQLDLSQELVYLNRMGDLLSLIHI